MKIDCLKIFLMVCTCLLFACQNGPKTTTPPVVTPKPGTVATPADISRPDKMTNNFQRMQGEWREVDLPEKKLQVRGKIFLEITEGAEFSELAQKFKVVKDCEGAIDMDGEFFMVGNSCYKILSLSINEMEVENIEQQRVVKYRRI